MPTKLGTWEKKTCLWNGCAQLESVGLGAEGLGQKGWVPEGLIEDLRCLLGLGAFFKSVILDSEEGGDARQGEARG